jgi:valyl-tRNA synthetase
MDHYEFSNAVTMIQQFFISNFCDVYLELIKPTLYGNTDHNSTLWTLYHVLDSSLLLMHPFMPYITEELWQRLPITRKTDSIMEAEYPSLVENIPDHDEMMSSILSIVQELRSIRHSLQLPPLTACIATDLDLAQHAASIATLTKAQSITIVPSQGFQTSQKMAVRVVEQCSIYVALPQDFSERIQVELAKLKEREKRLAINQQKYSKILEGLQGKEGTESIRASTERKLQEAREEVLKLSEAIVEMEKLL